MMAPVWMDSVIAEFGKAAGIGTLSLNERGAAVLRFETGVALRLEYSGAELVMAVTVPAPGGAHPETLKRLLAMAHPKARNGGHRVRAGYLAKSGELILAVRFAERDVTLPAMNSAFAALWRLAGEIGGAP